MEVPFFEIKSLMAITSVVFAIAGALLYMRALYIGHRPAWSSFLAWAIIGTTGFKFHLDTIMPEDPWYSAYLPATFAIIPMVYIVFLLILKAKWKLEARDICCLAAAVVCWLVWVQTHSMYAKAETAVAAIPMLVLVLTDAFSSWPILQSAAAGHERGKLNRWSWGLTAISTVCGLLAVKTYASSEVIYPLYLFGMMCTIAYLSLRSRVGLVPMQD